MDPIEPAPNPIESEPMSLAGIWHRFGDQFRRRARTRLRQYGLAGQAESMDICNDVMAELIRRQESDRDHGPPVCHDEILAYIMRAIDNQVIDTFRTLARQCRDFRRNESAAVGDMSIVSAVGTPSQIAIRREVMQRIRSFVSDEDARAIDLMLENRDWKEIGGVLGVKPDTARIRIRRALDRVRGQMGLSQQADP